MSASFKEMQQLRAYIGASRELTGWINGARVFALLSGAVDSGVMDALRTKSTVQQINAVTGVDEKSIVDLCVALEVHGVVQRDGECYELTPDFALLGAQKTGSGRLFIWWISVRHCYPSAQRTLTAASNSLSRTQMVPSSPWICVAPRRPFVL